VSLQVLRLCSELAVRPREEKLVGDQAVERRDVRLELRGADSRLESNDFRVSCAN
jgi:hypothetical protein